MVKGLSHQYFRLLRLVKGDGPTGNTNASKHTAIVLAVMSYSVTISSY